jgi:hypothetical protein
MASKDKNAADPKGSMQDAMDEETEQGFRGQKVDPTPNSAYTVAGVTSGEATPETDADLAAEAKAASGTAGESGESE